MLNYTLPIKEGGLSGPKLKPYTSRNINYINKFYKDCTIIAGGGIRSIKDMNDYKELGANHFSESSICFNPFSFIFLYMKYKSIFCD